MSLSTASFRPSWICPRWSDKTCDNHHNDDGHSDDDDDNDNDADNDGGGDDHGDFDTK